MAYAPYDILFADQNPNREFVIQPLTTNGPSSPTGGIDPSAAGANTTLYFYGQGVANYGDRTWENMVYLMEHFFSPIEPSFPIPGQVWAKSSPNELTTPFQLYMYNPRKYKITASSTNSIYVVSDDGSENAATVLTRFQSLGLSKSFNIYSSTYAITTVIQAAVPVISGAAVLLTVTPTLTASLVGQYTGGWEEVYQGNATITLRRIMNAGGFNIQNLANPVNPQDAVTKSYVDTAVSGGTITLGQLQNVTPSVNTATNGQFLTFNGSEWTNTNLSATGFLALTGGTMSGVINMDGYSITNLPAPVGQYDAVNLSYVLAQPLSSTNALITNPNNNDLLVYNAGTMQWNNSTAANAGIVPIAGGIVMAGGIDMGGNYLTGISTPVNPLDAVNKAYVDASVGGGVVSGVYNNTSGILTLNLTGTPSSIFVTGFFPTPGGTIPVSQLSYTIPAPSTAQNQFFALEYGQTSPTSTTLDVALNQVDAALGNFTVPRQRLVFPTPGAPRVAFDINGLAFASPVSAPKNTFVKGSHNLAVYLNGVKQVASTSAIATITSNNLLREDFNITFAGGTCTVAVNGAAPVTVSIGVQTTLAGVRNAINALALSYYFNPITGYLGGTNFSVPGNVVTQFPVGTAFTVRYSTNNNGTYNVSSAPTYNAIPNTTTIPVGVPINTALNDGVIFQDAWGFSTSIANGAFVFHSNIPGNASALTIIDTNLFLNISGITYPFAFGGSPWNTSNSILPADYAYSEIGMFGYQSSLFVFNIAPVSTDVMEVLIDREMVYTSTNPLAAATIS